MTELRVELPRYEIKYVDGKEVTFYIVMVNVGRRKWKLEQRYNAFSDLDKNMRATHANMPKLPAKTYFALKAASDIDNRRKELHHYLQGIVNRPDMRTNPVFRTFLEIDS